MRLSDAFLVGSLAVAGCEPGSVYMRGKDGLTDYIAPDSADTAADTGIYDSGTDSGKDSDVDTDSGDSSSEGYEVRNSSEAFCNGVIATLTQDPTQFAVRDALIPTVDDSGQLWDQFQVTLNSTDSDAVYQSMVPCARFSPSDGSGLQVLGGETARDLITHELEVTVDAIDLKQGTMSVWVVTLNEDGAVHGEISPDHSNPNTARNYTIFEENGIWKARP